jgi:nucleoside-diphosphate-sugar epimerase
VRQLLAAGKERTTLGRTPPEEKIPFLRADFTEAPALQEVLKGWVFDCILHVASLPGDTGDPKQLIRFNVKGCQSLREIAHHSRAKRFVLSSSISA